MQNYSVQESLLNIEIQDAKIALEYEMNRQLERPDFDSATNAILAYLYMLNHSPTLDKLSYLELATGRKNLMGCLHKVCDFFKYLKWHEVVKIINEREALNVLCSAGHPELKEKTAHCADIIYQILRMKLKTDPKYNTTYIKVEEITDPSQKRFLDELDKELSQIIGKRNK